jgi:hypothetical protein
VSKDQSSAGISCMASNSGLLALADGEVACEASICKFVNKFLQQKNKETQVIKEEEKR